MTERKQMSWSKNWVNVSSITSASDHLPNTKVFFCCRNLKREETRLSIPFSNCDNNKRCLLAFSNFQLYWSTCTKLYCDWFKDVIFFCLIYFGNEFASLHTVNVFLVGSLRQSRLPS